MVEEMAYKAPELRDRMQYPRSRNSLYHFMPIGSKYVYMCALLFLVLAHWIDLLYWSSYLILASVGKKKRRRVKHVNRKQLSTDLAQFYLQMKQRYNMHMSHWRS